MAGSLYERIEAPFSFFRVHLLEASDEDLARISRERNLALSLDEMRMMRDYFQGEGRSPTDVEVEAVAQAWSEHCSYKSSWTVMQQNIFRIEAPQSLLIIQEDAGLVTFDDEWAYVVAMESHNHPSALDPVGGAETGIGGILRDVLCMGAQPIALLDPLFFGPLDLPYSEVPEGTKHPLYLFRNVVAGIRDYGNRVGIPTVGGMVGFHPGYTSNCLVNVACLGMVRKDAVIRSRAEKPGEKLIFAGGRTGRDGIHGVSGLASQVLDEDSESVARSAVQMGDAITKEPLIHATLQCIEEGLVSGCKDFGGGGLSSCIGEIVYAGGNGGVIDLDNLPLKVADMAAWEIWVSESQERMALSVHEDKVDRVLAIMAAWDVDACVLGTVDDTKRLKIRYHGHTVLDLDLEFATGAVRYERPYNVPAPRFTDELPKPARDLAEVIRAILQSPNVACMSWITQQYDTLVRGGAVLGANQGEYIHPGPGDAAVLKPLETSNRGLAVATDVNPWLCELDPYNGAASALEESMRNVIATGGRPHSWADNLNFGNPENPDRMGEFRAATDAMYHVANALGVPCVSGNVSFYNEGTTGPIPPTPSIWMIGLVEDVTKAVSSECKAAGNPVYLLGETKPELAGSEYFRLIEAPESTSVPTVDTASFAAKRDALLGCMAEGMVRACHDVSQGGVAIAVLEMLFGCDLGLTADVSEAARTAGRPDLGLFSESNGRWLIEVDSASEQAFLARMEGLSCTRLGVLDETRICRFTCEGETLAELPVDEARAIWTGALPALLG